MVKPERSRLAGGPGTGTGVAGRAGRLTTQIIRRPWKQRIVADLDGGFGIQMFGHLAKGRSIHSRDHIASTTDYVREGRPNAFD